MKRHVAMWVRYDGTAYHGFQQQPDVRTIQQEIEGALARLTGECVRIYGAGRTDAGVHARKQVVHCTVASRIPLEHWCKALNAHLPDDIVVWHVMDVAETFHARTSATGKTYVYTIWNAPFPDPMRAHMQWHIVRTLHDQAMQEALLRLVGAHDFSAFCSVHSSARSRVRHIRVAKVQTQCHVEGKTMTVSLEGNGFLYNMVRIIVGTIVQVGLAQRDVRDVVAVLESRDRTLAGPTAPPHGLMLWDVAYDADASGV